MSSSSASWIYLLGHIPLTENTPLLRKSQSIKNKDTLVKKTSEKNNKWPEITVVLLILLLSETASGIVMPTLAPYVTSLGGDAVILGYTVSAFSGGRLGSAVVLGYLSNSFSYKAVLAGSLIVSVIGNLLYGLSYLHGPYFILASRVLTGIGAGSLSVQRAYIAHVTDETERTTFMSYLGAVQFFGFGVTPGLGSLIIYLPNFQIGNVHFNQFTMPSHILAVLNIIVLLLLLFFFHNPPPAKQQQPNNTNNTQKQKYAYGTPNLSTVEKGFAKPSSTPIPLSLNKTQMILVFAVFLGVNFMVRLVVGIIETIGTPLYMDLRGNGKSATSKEIEAGYLFGALGLIGMVVLFLVSYLSKWVADIKILVVGLVGLGIGMGLLIGNLNLVRFIVGCGFVWGIGYPLAQTLVISMFSKFLGGKPQGAWMGWIGAAGSVGRIVGPIVTGFLWNKFGQSETMIFGTVCACITLLASFVLFIIPK